MREREEGIMDVRGAHGGVAWTRNGNLSYMRRGALSGSVSAGTMSMMVDLWAD